MIQYTKREILSHIGRSINIKSYFFREYLDFGVSFGELTYEEIEAVSFEACLEKAKTTYDALASFYIAYSFENGYTDGRYWNTEEEYFFTKDDVIVYYVKAAHLGNAAAKEICIAREYQIPFFPKVEEFNDGNTPWGEMIHECTPIINKNNISGICEEKLEHLEEMIAYGQESLELGKPRNRICYSSFQETMSLYLLGKEGFPEAFNCLACYIADHPYADIRHSFYFFKLAADMGHAPSFGSVAYGYLCGAGDDKTVNYELANYWYQKAYNAKQKFFYSSYAEFLLDESTPYYNTEKAVEVLNAGVKKNCPSCMCFLADLYMEDDGVLPQNVEKAMELYKKSANRKFPAAKCAIADYLLANGNGQPEEMRKAYKMVRKVAEEDEYPEGMYLLGLCYINGWGTGKNYGKGTSWLHKAVNEGCEEAIEALYLHHINKKEYYEAIRWIKKGIDNGNVNAKYVLGICYKYGFGIDKDIKIAEQLIEEAIKDGADTSIVEIT